MGVSIGHIFTRFRFENFIKDDSNVGAFCIAKNIVMGHAFKVPIFIHSEAGLGKSHLLHAIANEVLLSAPKVKVALIDAEWFQTEYIRATKTNELNDFTNKLRGCQNIFIVDIISLINKKTLMQKELFQILKEQSENGCRVILASSLPLAAMTEGHDEFINWLQSSKEIEITVPSIESRYIFLKKCLAEHEMPTNDALIECINLMGGSSFRELGAAVIYIHAAANLDNKTPTADYTKKVFEIY